jgi:hypothetical protein
MIEVAMKCIDSIEGTVKCILKRIHTMSVENQLDDSEYIRNVKAIIDATEQYVHNNPEVVQDSQILKKVLYVHSRNLWLAKQSEEQEKPPAEDTNDEAIEYKTYYYDYVYNHNLYPR